MKADEETMTNELHCVDSYRLFDYDKIDGNNCAHVPGAILFVLFWLGGVGETESEPEWPTEATRVGDSEKLILMLKYLIPVM